MMNGTTHQLGSIESCHSIVVLPTHVLDGLILGLFLDALEVGSELGAERVESTAWGSPRVRGCGVETRRLVCRGRGWCWCCRSVVVDTFSVSAEVSEREIQPSGTWLFQVDAKMFQIPTLKPRVELRKEERNLDESDLKYGNFEHLFFKKERNLPTRHQ